MSLNERFSQLYLFDPFNIWMLSKNKQLHADRYMELRLTNCELWLSVLTTIMKLLTIIVQIDIRKKGDDL